MRYTNFGVNIDSIDKLILDIYDYAERINSTLNQISNVVEGTKIIYTSTNSTEFIKKFKDLESSFSNVNVNIKSYAEDLIRLKNRYQMVDENLTQRIKIAISKMNLK